MVFDSYTIVWYTCVVTVGLGAEPLLSSGVLQQNSCLPELAQSLTVTSGLPGPVLCYRAWLDRAWQGKAGHGAARPGMAWLGTARQGKEENGRTTQEAA